MHFLSTQNVLVKGGVDVVMLVFWLIYRLKGHFAEFAPLDSKLQWCQYICSCWTTKYSRILDIVWTMCAWEIQGFLYFCIPRFAPSNWWLKTNTEIDWDRLFLQHPSVYSDIDIYIYYILNIYILYNICVRMFIYNITWRALRLIGYSNLWPALT